MCPVRLIYTLNRQHKLLRRLLFVCFGWFCFCGRLCNRDDNLSARSKIDQTYVFCSTRRTRTHRIRIQLRHSFVDFARKPNRIPQKYRILWRRRRRRQDIEIHARMDGFANNRTARRREKRKKKYSNRKENRVDEGSHSSVEQNVAM